MAKNLQDSMRDVALEAKLLGGVVHGHVSGYEMELAELGDGDHLTLLHAAVRAGKADWVERLMKMEADPGLVDCGGTTAVELAEEMAGKHPGDADRLTVLKLVLRSGGAGLGATGEGCVVSCGDDTQTSAVLPPSASQSATGIASADSPPSSSTTSTPPEPSVAGEFQEASAQSATLALEAADGVRTEMAKQYASLKDSIDEIKRALISRDALLESLESSVTSLAEEWRPLRRDMAEVSGRVQVMTAEVEALRDWNSDLLQDVSRNTPERVRYNCVEALMKLTDVVNADDWKLHQVRAFYERLYSASTLTSCLLTFLQFQARLKIFVDCDSDCIDRMKGRFRDREGEECEGCDHGAFADLEELKVYLGGKVDVFFGKDSVVGELARSLAQLAVRLAFDNGGRPYEEGDELNRQEYLRIIESGGGSEGNNAFEYYIDQALNAKTQLAKEVYLIAAVPGVIAVNGPVEGTARLRQQVPALLAYYERHVMGTLINKSRI